MLRWDLCCECDKSSCHYNPEGSNPVGTNERLLSKRDKNPYLGTAKKNH